MNEYNASSIKILTDEEILKQDWYYAEMLAKQYFLPRDFVKRGFECSYRLGIEVRYFVDKYIYKKKGINIVPEFEEVYKEILKERNMSRIS
jgi:hypothetical protein